MTYGIIVNRKEMLILESNDINFVLWDFNDIFDNPNNNKIQIEFDDESEKDKALKLLGR